MSDDGKPIDQDLIETSAIDPSNVAAAVRPPKNAKEYEATDELPRHRLVIGMEVHLQLKTRTKCFSTAPVTYDEEPNTQVVPLDLGLPGTLPVLSRAALDQAIRGGLALGCEIAAYTKWDRKNYYYPDLPKGYQITQYDKPVCHDGAFVIDGEDADGNPTPRTVRILRAHLEEDTGRIGHRDDGTALIDYNRAGTPLLEIVTHPDLTTAAEAHAYLEQLKRTMQYLGVSDCDMEKGQLRCEPNVNVLIWVPAGGDDLTEAETRTMDITSVDFHAIRRAIAEEKARGNPAPEPGIWVPTRIVELKNLNSFAAVRNAIEYERIRQVQTYMETGERGPRPKSTRGWNDATRRTFLQREKEEAADYRYFPEPDLPPVTIAARRAEELRPHLPELPRARRDRFVRDLDLPLDDATDLTATRELADWFERAVQAAAGRPHETSTDREATTVAMGIDEALAQARAMADERKPPVPKTPRSSAEYARNVANWVVNDLLRELNARPKTRLATFPVPPEQFGTFVAAVAKGDIPKDAARKTLFPTMVDTGKPWQLLMDELGLTAALEAAKAAAGDGTDPLRALVQRVIDANPDIVAKARSGKPQVLNVLLGQVMKETRGTADPGEVRGLLEELGDV